jgi:low temperature requirement protein LtrA
MTSLRGSVRRWWQPPKSIRNREEERSVTFLELFYDLVYVVLISQLSHSLAEHVDWVSVFGFLFLFVTVWVAWVNGSMYHDLHGNNDIRTRVFTFLQMFTVAAMAVFAHSALGEGAEGFALSFATYQLVLTWLWWRTGVYDPNHRPLSQPYSLAFLVSTLLFVASVFVPAPWRFYLWGVALVISWLIPLYTFSQGKINPDVQAQLDIATSLSPPAVERFGLLTIIVLGEVIVGVVNGVAGHHQLTWLVGVTAALGMLIGIGLWWVYFDFISQHMPIDTPAKTLGWMYLHVPVTAGIVMTGAAVLNVVEHAGEPLIAEVRWLLVGTVGLALISTALLMRSIQIPNEHVPLYRGGGIVTLISGIVILLLGVSGLDTVPLLVIVIFLLLAPVLYGIVIWVKLLGGEEIPIT